MRSLALQALIGARSARAGRRVGWFMLCIGLVLAVAFADYVTGYEVRLSVLYLAPVMIATWMLGLQCGIGMAALASVAWYVTFAGSNPFSNPIYFGWEALVHASTAVIFAVVTDRLRLALEHSDERFVTVLEGLDAAVYVADERSGELVFVNERSRQAFGSLRSLFDIAVRFSEQGAPIAGGEVTDQQEVRDRVSGRWYLVNRRSIKWVDGSTVALHMATDITRRKEMEQVAQDREERLEMTSRLIAAGEMASTLAHELNQPLASILNYNTGCLALLQGDGASRADVIEGLEKSSEQAERAGAILQQVRDFIARREPQFAACDVTEVMKDCARLLASQASRSGVEIEIDAPEEVVADADKVMLQQLVLNLSKNAIEAMSQTTPRARCLTIRCRRADEAVSIEVADRGTGLPEDLRRNLFIPFFSTKPGGMGLGLQICRSIAEHHDGRLRACDRQGGGTTFQCWFPRTRP